MNRWKRGIAAAALIVVVVSGTRVSAQQPRAPTGAAQEGFVPVEELPKQDDRIPAPMLVATAYGFVWVALFGYVWSISRRLAAVNRELASLRTRVGAGTRPS
jgi:CcmD family protein